jgi:hypothetical protein
LFYDFGWRGATRCRTYSVLSLKISQHSHSLTSADCCLPSLSATTQQHKVSSRLQQLPDSAADQNRELRNAFKTSASERRTYQESPSGERWMLSRRSRSCFLGAAPSKSPPSLLLQSLDVRKHVASYVGQAILAAERLSRRRLTSAD